MKYFIDFEFLEGDVPCQIKGFNIPRWLIKPNNTIQPISVGICSSDDREYYAISKDFNLKEAWNRYDLVRDGFRDCGLTPNYKKVYWIRENVLKPIYNELRLHHTSVDWYYKNPHLGEKINDGRRLEFNYKSLKWLIAKYGKTNKQIAEEVYEFCSNNYHESNGLTFQQRKEYPLYDNFKPEFYGYYSDYDWVVLCWLFGRMINLPKGFPMYCIDLKQTLDKKANSFTSKELSNLVHPNCKHNVFELLGNPKFDLTHLGCLKSHPKYPKQTNEHNALADSKFARDLYKFLNTL